MVDTLYSCTTQDRLDTIMDMCIDNWREHSVDERNKLVETYINVYWTLTGRRPNTARLTELTDFILMDELTNSHPDKVTRTEYPILTDTQIFRRHKKTVLSGEEAVMDFLDMKYNTWRTGSNTFVHKKVTTEKRE